MDIDTLRKTLLLRSFQNELKVHPTNLQLREVLEKLEKTDIKPEKTDAEKMFDEVDKLIFKRPWTKLPPAHKIVKVKQYIGNIKELTKTTQEKLLEELTNIINDGKLGTKRHVVYDPEKELIETIPVLKIEGDSYILKK
jgi:hypothetical protein